MGFYETLRKVAIGAAIIGLPYLGCYSSSGCHSINKKPEANNVNYEVSSNSEDLLRNNESELAELVSFSE